MRYGQGVSSPLSRRALKCTHSVDLVDVLSPFVLLPLDPMSIEVGEETVDVGRTGREPVPFVGVVFEKRLAVHLVGSLQMRIQYLCTEIVESRRRDWAYRADVLHMVDEVRVETFVQVASHQVGSTYGTEAGAIRIGTSASAFPGCMTSEDLERDSLRLPAAESDMSVPAVPFIREEVQ